MTTTDAATEQLRAGWEDATPSDDTLSLAALRAMGDRAAAWADAAGGRVRREPGLVLADAGSPCLFLNSASAAAPIDVAAARMIGAFMEGAFVLLSPTPTPDLRPAGLQLMGHPPFLVRPAGGTAPTPPPGVTVHEVVDPAELVIWQEVLAAGFGTTTSRVPPALLGGPTRFWLARRDGEPVATAMSYIGHGVVDVEAVATLACHRRCGIGAAVTWAATLAEPTLPAVLVSSDDGVGVYRRMGFLPITRWTMWFHPSDIRLRRVDQDSQADHHRSSAHRVS